MTARRGAEAVGELREDPTLQPRDLHLRGAERVGDLLLRHLLDEAHPEQLALAVLELGERPGQAVPAVDRREVLVLPADRLGQPDAGLADGLDTELDGTTRLSGGEAQLLAFARVLLADPGLVVLDEATSRLDPDTEARVAAATRRLRQGRTLVVVAHRLATLDDLDEVCVVDDGRIVEHGDRAALAADPGSRYAGLRARQATAAAGGPPPPHLEVTS